MPILIMLRLGSAIKMSYLPCTTTAMNTGHNLLDDIHRDLSSPGENIHLVRGKYLYYHYGCDELDDRGWGCGYRTLQSILSWALHQQLKTLASEKGDNLNQSSVPSVPAIQEALVAMGDKPRTFIGSREWIGSFEVCLCLDYFHQVPCKILHVKSGTELDNHVDQIIKHFQTFGAPVMMGGDGDNSSKGILGVCEEPAALLVMDPHYYGNRPASRLMLQEDGWIKWWTLDKFMESSFYNLCFPQLVAPT